MSMNTAVSALRSSGDPNVKLSGKKNPLLPSAAYQLIKRGHEVIVERSAGTGAGYPDADYDQAGATLVSDHAAVFEKADLVVKVKEPLPFEYGLLRRGQLLFTYLHLAANRTLTDALMKSGVKCGATFRERILPDDYCGCRYPYCHLVSVQ